MQHLFLTASRWHRRVTRRATENDRRHPLTGVSDPHGTNRRPPNAFHRADWAAVAVSLSVLRPNDAGPLGGVTERALSVASRRVSCRLSPTLMAACPVAGPTWCRNDVSNSVKTPWKFEDRHGWIASVACER